VSAADDGIRVTKWYHDHLHEPSTAWGRERRLEARPPARFNSLRSKKTKIHPHDSEKTVCFFALMFFVCDWVKDPPFAAELVYYFRVR
jgi:hypothetical protein